MGADLSQRDLDFSRGIYALTANDIFRHMNRANHRSEFDVYCTFFEIYCTKVFDLFNEKKRLRVLEDHKNLVQVVGKKEERVDSGEQVMALIRRGMSVRTSGTTSANEHSSRSHAVFQITLKRNNSNKEFGKISLIDLAGSERGRDTQTNDKVTLMEGKTKTEDQRVDLHSSLSLCRCTDQQIVADAEGMHSSVGSKCRTYSVSRLDVDQSSSRFVHR